MIIGVRSLTIFVFALLAGAKPLLVWGQALERAMSCASLPQVGKSKEEQKRKSEERNCVQKQGSQLPSLYVVEQERSGTWNQHTSSSVLEARNLFVAKQGTCEICWARIGLTCQKQDISRSFSEARIMWLMKQDAP